MTMTGSEWTAFSASAATAIGDLEDALDAQADVVADEDATEEELADAAAVVDVKRRALALLRDRFFHGFRFDVDYIPPIIVEVNPRDNSIGDDAVALDAPVTIRYSEALNPDDIVNDGRISFVGSGGELMALPTSLTLSEDGTTITVGHDPFDLEAQEAYGGYHLKVRAVIRDLAGNVAREDYLQANGFAIVAP